MGSYQRDWSDKIEEHISKEMDLTLTENNLSGWRDALPKCFSI